MSEDSTPQATPEPVQPAATPASPEEVLAEWDESAVNATTLSQSSNGLIIIGTVAVALVLVAIGFFQRDITYYMAAVAAIIGGVALVVQNKTPTSQMHIVLSNSQIKVGKKSFYLAEMAGFWLQDDEDHLIINIEPKKKSLVPISFRFATSNRQEARSILLQVLPEVEARLHTIADSISRYLRF